VFHGGPPRSASWLLKDTTAAALGLCALLSQSAFAFSAVRWLGAAYLVYLGAKTLLWKRTLSPCPDEDRHLHECQHGMVRWKQK
jgi:threonine/homoserine/homoserine lactone efflux protein